MSSQMDDNTGANKLFLEKCKQTLLLILSWPFKCPQKKPLFSNEVQKLLRDTSESMETMRKKKNVGVISGSSAGIVGACLSITGSALLLVPGIGIAIGLGLLIPGIIIGTSGSGISTGFSLTKLITDMKKKKRIKQCLVKFVECLSEAATAFVKVYIALKFIHSMENSLEYPKNDLKALLDLAEKNKQKIEREIANSSVDAFFKIKCVNEHVDNMLDILTKNRILITGQTQIDYDENKVEEKISQVTKTPFDELETAICYLTEYRDDEQITFLTFILKVFEEKKLLEDRNEKNPLEDKTESNADLLKDAIPAGSAVNKATTMTVVSAGGLTAGNVIQVATKSGEAVGKVCHAGQEAAQCCGAVLEFGEKIKNVGNSTGLAPSAGMKSAAMAATQTTKVSKTVQTVGETTASLGSSTAGVTKAAKGATTTAASIGKVTKGIAGATIALSVIGIAVDAAFIGYSIYDLNKDEKEDFPRLVDNAVEIMEKLNNIVMGRQ